MAARRVNKKGWRATKSRVAATAKRILKRR